MNLPQNTLLQNGRYKIVRFISSGGFGCTYEAVHVKLGKRVAIKEFFVKDFCNRDENTASVSVGTMSKMGLVKRLATKFCEEAQALSQLNHPGIVKVTDVFDENGTSYFVMDFIDGRSLNEIVKSQGPLPVSLAITFITQVASALKYVHAYNRLHLDVKPGNIMVNKQGQAILIDFGASKQYDEVGGENTSTLLGKTPGYAPIEQMGNDVVQFHPSTDIYALGATFYKLITGKTPKSATLRVSGEELDPLPENTPKGIRKAIIAAMELNKKNRPQSIDEFLAILNGDDTTTTSDSETQVNDASYLQSSMDAPQSNVSSPTSNGIVDVYDEPSEAPKKGGAMKIILAVVAVLVIGGGIFFGAKMMGDAEDKSADERTAAVDSIATATDLEVINTKGVKYVYTGQVNSDNLPSGTGEGIYSNKYGEGKYKGEYVNGLREGQGEFVVHFKNGDVNTFVGVFKNDEYFKGKLTLKDGSFFQGEFQDERPWIGKWFEKNGTYSSTVKNGEEN